MASKTVFAERVRSTASVLANIVDDIASLHNVFFDRGYNVGGADPLTDEELTTIGLSVADVTGMITFAEALGSFLTANRGYISKMRNDL